MPNYPAMVPKKKIKDELRSCKGCNLTVMAKGDYHGWKGVDMGRGEMHWFCDKLPCRQLRDESIARRSQEMLVEQQQHAATVSESQEKERLVAENAELRAKLAELEAGRLAEIESRGKARQSSAPEPGPGPEPVEEEAPPPEASVPIEVHIIATGGKALCGATDGPMVKQTELTWDTNPCTECATRWSKIQTGEESLPATPAPAPEGTFEVQVPSSDGKQAYKVSLENGAWTCECAAFKYRQTCRHIALGVGAQARQQAEVAAAPPPEALEVQVTPAQVDVPLVEMTLEAAQEPAQPEPELPAPQAPAEPEAAPATPSSAASALYGERPRPQGLDSLPKFSPGLIQKAAANPDAYLGRTILVPPAAYPELDMAATDPERLRGGISALFNEAGLQVDRIERAAKGDEVVGIVFTLRRS